MSSPDKHALYQAAVQDPAHDAFLYQSFFKKVRGKEARSLREDFCGTFVLSCEWVKSHLENSSISLDLDPAPLQYGKAHGLLELNEEQRSRVSVLERDVIGTTPPRDLIIAGNFSFYIFQERKILLSYFKSCLKSLKIGQGALILDMVGGPGMVEKGVETKKVTLPGSGSLKKKFTYFWETKDFDPISSRVNYAIHFKLPNGRNIKNAFTYDWRLWTIREVRELLAEAGFSKSLVLWDVARSIHSEKHEITERGANLESWIAYVVGLA